MAKHEKLIFVDLETTGANPLVDRITEIGIVEVQGEQVSRWSTLVNPQAPIPPFIQNLTGINDAMVADAPVFSELAEDLLERLRGGLFIAHNARFDYGFLRNAFKAIGLGLRADVLCTVKLSRKLYPKEPKHNLDALVQRHQLQAEGDRHRALADADLLWQFWSKLKQEIAPETFEQALAHLLQRPSTPSHLDPGVLDDIPDTPGVYLFYGENNALLYVGKSVHLRQRVLSHFNGDHRLFQDMRMSQQIHRLEWRETAGELGALLLEAQLIKDLQPIHNRALRRQRELCAWQLCSLPDGASQPVLVNASEVDFGATEGLYGLFKSRKKAETSLREIAETHELCLAVLGLEKGSLGKPCFAHQLRRCRGACCGKESMALHQARLQAALAGLKLSTWPYPGPVALIEKAADGSGEEAHVVHNWCYLGSARAEADVWSLLEQSPARPAFDVDTYKLLVRALVKKQVKVRPLPHRPDQAAA
jgi:DNA polymerase-3 subunit epsilon